MGEATLREYTGETPCRHCGDTRDTHYVQTPGGDRVAVWSAGCRPMLIPEHVTVFNGRHLPVPEGVEVTPVFGTDEFRSYVEGLPDGE